MPQIDRADVHLEVFLFTRLIRRFQRRDNPKKRLSKGRVIALAPSKLPPRLEGNISFGTCALLPMAALR